MVCVPEGRHRVAGAVTRALDERVATPCARVPEVMVRPPDRFIAGEESALARWVESGQSLPSFRPDKGSALRIGRRGALVHNAETLAHVALIARTGPDAFRSHGLVEDPGTSLVTISGAVEHPGVVEIDRGTPLIDIADRAVPTGPPQALLVGGYGGAWVGPAHFTTPYASLSLRAIGATAGVGIVIVLGPHRLWPHGVGARRPLPGGPECRPVRPVRLRVARRRRRPDAPGPRAGRSRPPDAARRAGSLRSTAGAPAAIPTVR